MGKIYEVWLVPLSSSEATLLLCVCFFGMVSYYHLSVAVNVLPISQFRPVQEEFDITKTRLFKYLENFTSKN